MERQAVEPTEAFMVVFEQPGRKMEREKQALHLSFLRDQAQDEIFTLLQSGHRRKNIFIQLLLLWALRKPPTLRGNYNVKISDLFKRAIIYRFQNYSFSLYFCWHNVSGEEKWKENPDYKLTFEDYERDSVLYKKTDFDRKKAIGIMSRILDIMEPLVDKQLPRTRLNCWMDADNIKVEITDE